MSKYVACAYCKDELEIHHISLHQKQCYLRPENLKKICDYFISGISNHKFFKRAHFYRWAQQNSILTSISITNRLKCETWQHAIYQLLIYGYLHSYIDYEIVEVILYIVSNGTMWMEIEDYRFHYTNSLMKEYKNNGVTLDDYYYNYYLLLMCILDRATRDIEFDANTLDENKEEVNLKSAVTFLQMFAPDLLKSKIRQGNISDDAKQFLKKEKRG